MNIARHDGNDHVRIAVAGELDMATAGQLRDHLHLLLAADRPRLVLLDLDGVTFCDSTGISTLVAALASFASWGSGTGSVKSQAQRFDSLATSSLAATIVSCHADVPEIDNGLASDADERY